MPEQGAQDKTEKPTPRRRSKARQKGQVAKSQELGSVGVLLGGLASLWLFGGYIYGEVREFTVQFLSHSAQYHLTDVTVHQISVHVMSLFWLVVAPVMVAVVVAAIISNLVQVGFLMAPSRLKLDFKRLNPVEGFKKFASMRMFVELAKNILKMTVVGYVSYLVMAAEWNKLPDLSSLEMAAIMVYLVHVCMKLFLWAVLAMAVLALADYFYQRHDYEKNLKMSKQEIKDEYKQSEGDPKVKARIRSIQMEQARRRMMSALPQADVVITNPTHLAVALAYQAGEMDAPQVVAKGRGKLAEKIKEIAREHGIPVIEDKPLAQALFKAVDVGGSIPFELYEAVASILAHVYRLRNQHREVLDSIGAQRTARERIST
ncbi:MAG: flagellar biosynthesis protein FlhB [Deltaproteobacteria bacterium]|nr:flagellar biosynthesis protein FlhB [Deltaproteobacteria bacterium]